MQLQTPPQHVMQIQPAPPQPTQLRRAPGNGQPLCSFYGSQPGCRNGTRCAFRHEIAAPGDRASTWPEGPDKKDDYVPLPPPTGRPAPKKQKQAATKRVGVCMSFVIEGKVCDRGDKCPYEHPDTPKWPADTCMFHVTSGKCRNGEKCSFEHPSNRRRRSGRRSKQRDDRKQSACALRAQSRRTKPEP